MKTFLLIVALATSTADPRATELPATDLRQYALKTAVAEAEYTVVEFFSATCPCQLSHDSRLVALARKFKPRGVQVLAVDSNFGADVARNLEQVKDHGYPFPIVADPDALWMTALGAKYSTEVVVLDRDGKVRYRGGIDSDSHPATDKAKPYLDDALEALLSGRQPNPAVTRSMGCALQRW